MLEGVAVHLMGTVGCRLSAAAVQHSVQAEGLAIRCNDRVLMLMGDMATRVVEEVEAAAVVTVSR